MQSISYIERELVMNGARNIVKKYDDKGRAIAVIFQLEKYGIPQIPIFLPAKVEACEKILLESVRKPQSGTLQRMKEQAERTAWKIVYDWVVIQMSMVRLGQAEMMEIFLPYAMINDKQTFYQYMASNNFKMLESR